MTRNEILARVFMRKDSDGYLVHRCEVCGKEVGSWTFKNAKKYIYRGIFICRDIDCQRAAERRAAVKP